VVRADSDLTRILRRLPAAAEGVSAYTKLGVTSRDELARVLRC
jgi:hypothetical protein